MLEISGGFVLKCDNCGTKEEYGAEVLSPAKINMRQDKPLGAYIEYAFEAELVCRCGQEQSIRFLAAEYPEGLHLEGSDGSLAEGCRILEEPDIDDQRVF